MLPLVTVIIPTYNYANYITNAVESVCSQSYPQGNIEIIIIDDGSTDNTKEVLKHFIDLGIVTYHYQNNDGKASATSKAIKMAKGKYIFNLDADDYFLTNKIEKSVEIFEKYPDIAHVGSPARVVSNDIEGEAENIPREILDKPVKGNELLRYFYDRRMLYGGGSTYAARASVLKNVNIPKEVDMYIDEYLIIVVLLKGDSFFISEPLSVWRVHQNNYSVGKIDTHKKKIKLERLLKSSEGVLNEIEKSEYPFYIKNIYMLQHKIRELYFKEELNEKTIFDILRFTKMCFITNHYTLGQLRNYSAFNRMLPQAVGDFVRKFKLSRNS